MKLPAVAIAAAFACGIALGLHPTVVLHVTSVFLLSTCIVGTVVLLALGLALAKIERLFPAAIISLLSWTLLGFLAACFAEQPRPANHVMSLLEQKRLSLESPLRWHGRLRDEPARLPWGHGFEVDLAGRAWVDETLAAPRNRHTLQWFAADVWCLARYAFGRP
jgi:hypothetical protein